MNYEQFLKHTCCLDLRQDIVDALTPPGFLYAFRVWLRRWTMSSNTDQRSKMFLKSNYAYRLDRKKHYNLYFWSIHPLSDAASLWERIYLAIFMLSIFFYPFTVGLAVPIVIYLNFVLDLLFMVNMILEFFLGYINEARKEIILDRREIARHYLLSFFIIDLVTSLPLNFIMYLVRIEEVVTAILRGFRILRSITIIKVLRIQQQRHGYAEIINKIAIIILLYVLGIWCSASVIVVRTYYKTLSDADRLEISYLFLKSLHKVTMTLMLAHVDVYHDNELEMTFEWIIILLSLGYLIELTLLTHFLMIVSRSKGSEFKFKSLKEELADYCELKQLPPQMYERLDSYYSFRYQHHFYNNADIDYVLTDHLKQEVQVACMKRFVQEVDIFSKLPMHILLQLVLAFKREYFLRNDILMEQGTASDCLYIINVGNVALYDNDNKEVCHLEDGCYIGELTMLFNVETNMPTTVAISSCEIFVLKKKIFEHIMKSHKTELNKMYDKAHEKLQKTMYVMQLQGYDFIPPQIVITECLEKKMISRQ